MNQKPDTKPGFYYVSARREDGATTFLAGPWLNNHQAALDALPAAKAKAMDRDVRAPWYSYGTCRAETDHGPGLFGLM